MATKNKPDRAKQARKWTKSANRGGRPRAISLDDLLNRRDGYFSFLTDEWAEVGWSLTRASSREELRTALGTVPRPSHLEYLLRPFTHSTKARASRTAVREARAARSDALRREQEQEAVLREAEPREAQCKAVLGESPTPRADVMQVVPEEYERFATIRQNAGNLLICARADRTGAEAQIADQESALAQDQLLRFIAKKKYVLNPRNLANAMAGVPSLKCWQSYRRCSEQRDPFAPCFPYWLVGLVDECWRGRPDHSKAALLAATRARLDAMKRPEHSRERSMTAEEQLLQSGRQRLIENWLYLRRAVLAVDLTAEPAERIPYLIVSAYRNQCGTPRHAAEVVLAEREARELSIDIPAE